MPAAPRPRRAQRADAGEPLTDAIFIEQAEFRNALRAFLHFSEQAARDSGLTPAQHQLMLAVRASPRGWLAVGELARELRIRPHSAVGLTDRAERSGLVLKETDPGDLRRVRVSLTAKGQRLIHDLTAANRIELAHLWDRIPSPM